MHTYMQAEIPAGISNPVVGRYSKTDSTKGPTINKAFDDGANSIIVGRRPYADLAGLVSDPRKNGGNTIRTDYERERQGC